MSCNFFFVQHLINKILCDFRETTTEEVQAVETTETKETKTKEVKEVEKTEEKEEEVTFLWLKSFKTRHFYSNSYALDDINKKNAELIKCKF